MWVRGSAHTWRKLCAARQRRCSSSSRCSTSCQCCMRPDSMLSRLPWKCDTRIAVRAWEFARFGSEQRHMIARFLKSCSTFCHSRISAMQALGLEVLQLLQFVMEYNPGLVSASQGCESEGCEGLAAGAALEQSLWRGVLVGCLPAGHCIYTAESSFAWRNCGLADARSGLVLASQDLVELSQDQREALREARDVILDMYCELPSQRAALTSQLQVRHVYSTNTQRYYSVDPRPLHHPRQCMRSGQECHSCTLCAAPSGMVSVLPMTAVQPHCLFVGMISTQDGLCMLQAAPAETAFYRQTLILRQLHANADAAFVQRLMLELLTPV